MGLGRIMSFGWVLIDFDGLDEESLEDHSLVGIYQSLGNSMSFIRF
jgi:hypothetical protein